MSKKNDFKKQIYGNPNWINGRINRAEYIIRTILTGITFGFSFIGATTLYVMGMMIPAILVGIFALWMYWRIVMAYVKRLHDLGWNGWLAVLLVVYEFEYNLIKNDTLSLAFELLVVVLSLFLALRKGDDGANKYGKDPLMKYEENQ